MSGLCAHGGREQWNAAFWSCCYDTRVPCTRLLKNQPPRRSSLEVLSVGSHSFGLEFCSPPLPFPVSFSTAKSFHFQVARHVAATVAPFTIPGSSVRISPRPGSCDSHLWTERTMSSPHCRQCGRYTGGDLQHFLSVGFVYCEPFRQWRHGDDQQCANDVHYKHIHHDHRCHDHHNDHQLEPGSDLDYSWWWWYCRTYPDRRLDDRRPIELDVAFFDLDNTLYPSPTSASVVNYSASPDFNVR